MMNLEKILQKYSKYILVLIFILALVLRWWPLHLRLFSFEFDQARDAFITQEIAGGHLKVLGPPTSGVPGLFHGVLYYYVITPAYALAHGDPLIAAYWMAFIGSLGVFAVYYLAYLLTKKITPALISALIFAVSFDAIQFAGFLSNATMGIWFVPLIYIGLYLWINKSSKWAPLITGLAFGLSVQSEIAFYYHLTPVILWLIIYRNKITKREIIIAVGSFIFAVSTMLIAEVKFGFQGVRGLVYLFTSQDATAQAKQFSDFLITYLNQVGLRFANTIFPLNVVFGSLIGFIIIIYSIFYKYRYDKDITPNWSLFLATYITAHFIALPFGGSSTPHIMIGAIPGIAVFLGIFIWKTFKNIWILVFSLLFIVAINIFKIDSQNRKDANNLHQNYVNFADELEVIDYTYQKAGGKAFSISTLTAPLYINTRWSYLYNWYGKNKYGYLPYWIGKDQVGQLGNNLQVPPPDVKEHFFIEEPVEGTPAIWVTYAIGDQEAISTLVEQKQFAGMTVQERIIKNAKQ